MGQLHQLEAEKLIHTNQIAALESERSQLIGEKEELQLSSAHWQSQEVMEEEHLEVMKELRERLVTLRSEGSNTRGQELQAPNYIIFLSFLNFGLFMVFKEIFSSV